MIDYICRSIAALHASSLGNTRTNQYELFGPGVPCKRYVVHKRYLVHEVEADTIIIINEYKEIWMKRTWARKGNITNKA